jgi:hypothetical protein
MVNTTTSGLKVAVFADWQQAFAIVDRVGMSIELVPNVLDELGDRQFRHRLTIGEHVFVSQGSMATLGARTYVALDVVTGLVRRCP